MEYGTAEKVGRIAYIVGKVPRGAQKARPYNRANC